MSHLRRIRKSKKIFKSANLQICDLRNLFADRPPKYKPTKQYSLLRKCTDKIGKGQFLLAAKTVRRNKFQVVTLMTSNLSLQRCERYEIKVVEGGGDGRLNTLSSIFGMKLDSSHRVNWHLHKLIASSTSKPYKGSSHFALLSETVFLNF